LHKTGFYGTETLDEYKFGSGIFWMPAVIFLFQKFVYLHMITMKRSYTFNK